MEAEDEYVVHYFVDEAGDPTLFSRKGKILVGAEGCSRYFILGKLDIAEPARLAQKLDALRAELLADPYFKEVPSMQAKQRKTALAFHAKDDIPEVRREVFKLLLQEDLRFYAVVRDKRALLDYVRQRNEKEAAYRYNGNELYDTLVRELFRKLRGGGIPNCTHICFAKRGSSERTEALNLALEHAHQDFERSFGVRASAKTHITSSTPPKNVGLQAVDYYLWALQRFYERREQRYLNLIWPQVGEIHDLDFIEKRQRGIFYRQGKPLTLEERFAEDKA